MPPVFCGVCYSSFLGKGVFLWGVVVFGSFLKLEKNLEREKSRDHAGSKKQSFLFFCLMPSKHQVFLPLSASFQEPHCQGLKLGKEEPRARGSQEIGTTSKLTQLFGRKHMAWIFLQPFFAVVNGVALCSPVTGNPAAAGAGQGFPDQCLERGK